MQNGTKKHLDIAYVGSEHIQSPSLGVTLGLLRPKLSPPGGMSLYPPGAGNPLPNMETPRLIPGGGGPDIPMRSICLPRPLPPL